MIVIYLILLFLGTWWLLSLLEPYDENVARWKARRSAERVAFIKFLWRPFWISASVTVLLIMGAAALMRLPD
jgi:hypothetical protein